MRDKRILILVFVVAFLFLLVGCYPTPSAKIIGIKVSPDKITLPHFGATLQLKVDALYDDGNHGDITSDCIYRTSNSFIVVVDSYEGKVTAKAPGKATITVTYNSEGIVFTDYVEVTVEADSIIVKEEII